jgi:hypothetical protein
MALQRITKRTVMTRAARRFIYISARLRFSRPIAFITAIKNVAGNAPRLIFAAIDPLVSSNPCSRSSSASSS